MDLFMLSECVVLEQWLDMLPAAETTDSSHFWYVNNLREAALGASGVLYKTKSAKYRNSMSWDTSTLR